MEQKAKSIGKIAWSQWLTPYSLLGLETKGLVKPPQQQGLQIGSGVTNSISAGILFLSVSSPQKVGCLEIGPGKGRCKIRQCLLRKGRWVGEVCRFRTKFVHQDTWKGYQGRSVCLSKSLKKKCHEICLQVWTELSLLSIQSFQKENQLSNICFYFTEQSQGREKRSSGWPQTHAASVFAACSTSVHHHSQVFDFSVREANWRWEKGVETGNGPVCHTD